MKTRDAAGEPRTPTCPPSPLPADSGCSGFLPFELARFLLLLTSAEAEQRRGFIRVIIVTAGDRFSLSAFRSRSPTDTGSSAHNRPVRSAFKVQFRGGAETLTGPECPCSVWREAAPLAFVSCHPSTVQDSYHGATSRGQSHFVCTPGKHEQRVRIAHPVPLTGRKPWSAGPRWLARPGPGSRERGARALGRLSGA